MKEYYFENFSETIDFLEAKMLDYPPHPLKPVVPEISKHPSIEEVEKYKLALDVYSNNVLKYEEDLKKYELEEERISKVNDLVFDEASVLFEKETGLEKFNSEVKDKVYIICYDNASENYYGRLGRFKNYFHLTTELVELLNLK